MQVEYWHWWILATVLAVAEIFAPGAVLIWLGIAAGVVGAVVFFIPALPIEAQFFGFAILSGLSIYLWRKYGRQIDAADPDDHLNQRNAQYVGKILTLTSDIENGQGRARVGDGSWLVEGPDMPEGSKVKVVDCRGTVLIVEAVPQD